MREGIISTEIKEKENFPLLHINTQKGKKEIFVNAKKEESTILLYTSPLIPLNNLQLNPPPKSLTFSSHPPIPQL